MRVRSARWFQLAVLVTMVLAIQATVGLAQEGVPIFEDTADSVHESAIQQIAAAGITMGCNPPGNTLYCPNSPVTRGQMAAFLVRAFSLPSANSAGFSDTSGTVFSTDIDRLAAAGITKGCNPPTNSLFCPNGTVTRGQMAAFLVRTLGLVPVADGRFIDTSMSEFSADIDALAAAGITLGCNPPTNDRFCPTATVTRAEMATFLIRSLAINKPAPDGQPSPIQLPPPPPLPPGLNVTSSSTASSPNELGFGLLATPPNSVVACGVGTIFVNTPVVTAQQAAPGATNYTVLWINGLWYWDGVAWQHLAWSQWFGSYVASNDANPGSVWGYAGPVWHDYNSGQAVTQIYWEYTSGYYYASINYVYDRGEWTPSLTYTNQNVPYCWA